MSELSRIQSVIQSCSVALAGLLQVEVTVVDSSLHRIAGTGIFASRIGERIAASSAFQNALASGSASMVRDVRTDHICSGCARRGECAELANIAHPIFLNGKVLGVIGIAAFQSQARARLWREAKNLQTYLDAWSRLIENRVQELEQCSRKKPDDETLPACDAAEGVYTFLSPLVVSAFDLAARVSMTDSSVLITGESGTGKEVLARMIHNAGPRAARPMVSINCGGIPRDLIESELFGYEGGAFTGALRDGKPGKFELADSGTIFLDEIGDLPLSAQSRLLRVLQERTVDRVGGGYPVPVDVRVISATHRDLKRMVAEGTFREDLYYRLCVVPIELPPLRERKEDILPLARYLMEKCSQKFSKSLLSMDTAATNAFREYPWPGNVREMKNAVEYIANVASGTVVGYGDLPQYLRRHIEEAAPAQICEKEASHSLAELMRAYERALLGRMAAQAGSEAAKEALARRLGISRATLYRKLAALGLSGARNHEKEVS